jgi:hypothetical protein
MSLIPFLRWTGRATGSLLALVVAIDVLTDRFGYRGLLDFRQSGWLEHVLPLLVVTGALGLTYSWHREHTGANIALACGLIYTGICAIHLMPYVTWLPGAALIVPASLLLMAERIEFRRGLPHG